MPYDLRAAVTARQNLRTQLLAMYPTLDTDDDADALNDTLEGLDTLNEDILAVLRNALEREAMAKAIDDDLIARLVARSRRLKEGAQSLRAAVLQAMQEAGLRSIKAADMSISVGRGKPKVLILDAALVPGDLCKTTVEPSKALIAAALAEEKDIPGVTLGNPQAFLSIHRS